MLFNSLEFLVFYVAVFMGYWMAPARLKKPLLLAASWFFYAAWDWRFLGLILASSGTDFICGNFIFAGSNPNRKKAWVVLSLATNLGILGFFKYFHFFADSLHALFPGLPVTTLHIILPVGISFFTFQSLSYTIDIYRGRIKPVSALDFFLFVSFFPQLEAGPIVRASEFLPQLHKPGLMQWEFVSEGAWLFAKGFCKKILFADLLAQYANPIFAQPGRYQAWECLFAVYAFAFQIYWDFSGYTDMARGSALALGFRFPENFNLPYLSASPREFWRRWHMTLSGWLRDYLYKSLGGDRAGLAKTLGNLLVTMTLGGLWHGANWTFVIWGLYHGALLAMQRAWDSNGKSGSKRESPAPGGVRKAVQIVLTFNLVCIGWIFFRCENLSLAWELIGRIALGSWHWNLTLLPITLALFVFAGWQWLALHLNKGWLGGVWSWLNPAVTAICVALAFVYSTGSNPFLYFQF